MAARKLSAALITAALVVALALPLPARAEQREYHGHIPEWWSETSVENDFFETLGCDITSPGIYNYDYEWFDCGRYRHGWAPWPEWSDGPMFVATRVEWQPWKGGIDGAEVTLTYRWGQGPNDYETIGTCIAEGMKICVFDFVFYGGNTYTLSYRYCGPGEPIRDNCPGLLKAEITPDGPFHVPEFGYSGYKPEPPTEPHPLWRDRSNGNNTTTTSPRTRFIDVPESHTFYADVEWLAAADITRGCNPPDNTRFCPDQPVTRGQMAAFLVRALGLKSGSGGFSDTTSSVFKADIAALAAAGITRGCNPPTNDRFCPDAPVTRGQMAAFLRRAAQLDS